MKAPTPPTIENVVADDGRPRRNDLITNKRYTLKLGNSTKTVKVSIVEEHVRDGGWFVKFEDEANERGHSLPLDTFFAVATSLDRDWLEGPVRE